MIQSDAHVKSLELELQERASALHKLVDDRARLDRDITEATSRHDRLLTFLQQARSAR